MKRLFLVVALSASVLVVGVGQASATAILLNPGFNTNIFPANDDGSVGPVNIGFSINFFGLNQATLFVNNNGNVTFTGALSTFTPFAITGGSLSMLAPFFGDVDTRGVSNQTKYGNDTVDGHNAFAVKRINARYCNPRSPTNP